MPVVARNSNDDVAAGLPISGMCDCSLRLLLDAARAGDAAAEDRLLAGCRSYLLILAEAQVGRWMAARVDASDLVQQTLLDAHRGLKNFQGQSEEQWLAWLRNMLRHNAADLARRHAADKRQVQREARLDGFNRPGDSTAAFDPASSSPTPSQVISRQEAVLRVADAVAALPDDYRQVIVLRNIEGLAFDEVARRMQRSRPAVQMLWMRAVNALRQSPALQSVSSLSLVAPRS